ncbi:L,D-transpeptidase [Prevotellamassilia timonensis]|uniref:L,D-transpeptidase n=1 Tax=Prevotellamassilia timonensis TaxID=1852370 RepID=UPI0030791BDF
MRLICAICLLAVCGFFAACGSKSQSDAVCDDSTQVTEDSVLQQMANEGPTEDEIAALTDSAKQEKPKALDEKYRGLHIYVSKTTMHLYVLDANDSVLFNCGIACGLRRGNKTAKGDYRTPEGQFHISGMFNSTDWVHRTRDGRAVKGCYGPHFLRLATGRLGGIGIHGTNSPRSIGKRASEGCIRVNSANIITLFNEYAYSGMPVEVSAEGAPLPAFKGLAAPKKDEGESVRNEPVKHEKDSLHRKEASHSGAADNTEGRHERHKSADENKHKQEEMQREAEAESFFE